MKEQFFQFWLTFSALGKQGEFHPNPLIEPYPDEKIGTGCDSLPSYGSSNSYNKYKLILFRVGKM